MGRIGGRRKEKEANLLCLEGLPETEGLVAGGDDGGAVRGEGSVEDTVGVAGELSNLRDG